MGEQKRPFGVGLLIAGYDDLGAHLYQTCPNAECFEYYVSFRIKTIGILNRSKVSASQDLS